jgi:SNF2 family DNA or RNA helicase
MFDEEGFALEESEEDISFIEGVRRFVSDEIPNKFIKAADITENIINNGGKVVIWASFIRNIEKLKSYLNSRGINCKELYGATPINGIESENDLLNDTRESIVTEFNRDDSSFRVIIANPFAVAESISLHKKCHNAIYLERSFNAAHFIQSKDRIHRYGLKEDTITKYYYLISESSIDETINDRLKLKEMRLNEIMESMPIPLFDNTLESGGIEDIKAILRDYATRAKKI